MGLGGLGPSEGGDTSSSPTPAVGLGKTAGPPSLVKEKTTKGLTLPYPGYFVALKYFNLWAGILIFCKGGVSHFTETEIEAHEVEDISIATQKKAKTQTGRLSPGPRSLPFENL